jgi:hypothetical protein
MPSCSSTASVQECLSLMRYKWTIVIAYLRQFDSALSMYTSQATRKMSQTSNPDDTTRIKAGKSKARLCCVMFAHWLHHYTVT